jgi:membrane associated rhomboid family serine protease
VIPVRDSVRSTGTPWVNYGLILLNVAVFLYMLSLSTDVAPGRAVANRDFLDQTNGACYGFQTLPTPSDAFVCKWAFQPKEFYDNLAGKSDVAAPDRPVILISIITAMFLHAGWLHIIGNMLFLWVFGDNVEGRMGHAGYLLFYLLCGVVATLVQGFIDTTSLVPVLGASGAIAGILGAYIVYFPRATVRVVIPFFIFILIPIPVPAWLMIGLWFLQNLLQGVASINNVATPDAGVAFFAHIGGFVFGLLTVLVFLRGAGRRTTRRVRAP